MRVEPLDAKMVAVLHDVVEDCREKGYDFARLEREGFSPAVVSGVRAVTKLPDEEGKHSDPGYEETYLRFVRRAAAHPLGRLVKIADLEDNLDLGRIAHPTERDLRRMERYRRALEMIRGLPPPA